MPKHGQWNKNDHSPQIVGMKPPSISSEFQISVTNKIKLNNNRYNSKFPVGYLARYTPDEGRRAQWQKRSNNNNRGVGYCPNINNDNSEIQREIIDLMWLATKQ